MSGHTPTPWQVNQLGDLWHVSAEAQQGSDFGTICDMYCRNFTPEGIFVFPNAEANAEFIVRACNSHDELLAALKELVEVAGLRGDSDLPHPCDDPKLWTARMQTAWDEAAEVIAKAEGGAA